MVIHSKVSELTWNIRSCYRDMIVMSLNNHRDKKSHLNVESKNYVAFEYRIGRRNKSSKYKRRRFHTNRSSAASRPAPTKTPSS
ncbi:unnamed protein product [Gongylonema pulchrum]|uniref:Ovule protein n=1 Tax=Gongylonema pulchrum TaxID=637853 RepID=A0A183ESD5_9BILA|nr:unnamed protein product [Gongylonema pulchrum]